MSTSSATHPANTGTTEHHACKWLTYLARFGYAARGVVYLLVGGIAVSTALGWGNDTEGSRGALRSLSDSSWGLALLVAIGLGLIGYSVWRAMQAIFDADDHGTDAKGLTVRAGLMVSSLTHLALAGLALSLAFGWGFGGSGDGGSGGGGGGGESWTAIIMGWPGGRWLVAAVGACIIGAGVAQFIKGYKAGFMKHFVASFRDWPWAKTVCRIGLSVRGAVFCVFGFWIIGAAWQHDASDAQGTGGVLEWLEQMPWLLGLVAVGLLFFGVYSLLESYYRRVDTPDEVPGD